MIKNKKSLLIESGIRDIKDLSNHYKKAKIYFHIDLDGVTTAIAMKEYLKKYGIRTVDAETIQYGTQEFAIKKPDASGEIMPVLVDFAHGKPMFVIHTDHHDTQAGAEFTKSKQFSHSRSNARTISDVISSSDLFGGTDITAISTVDSADFIKYNITPSDLMRFQFKYNPELANTDIFKTSKFKDSKETGVASKNRFILAFVTNKLLLAFKSKPNFLTTLVLECSPSIINIYQKIKEIMGSQFKETIEDLIDNQIDYIERRKEDRDVDVKKNIIFQYGIGYSKPTGSYDRYTPFENNPDADFLITAYPMGMVQVSCNPFKENRKLKGINLGEIKDEVLKEMSDELKSIKVPLSSLKWISESDKDFTEESVGFTYKDLKALYGKVYENNNEDVSESELEEIMDKHFNELDEDEMRILDNIIISGLDVVVKNSGGHKCITNISGLNYLKRSKRPPVDDGTTSKYETRKPIKNIELSDVIIEQIEVNSKLFSMDKRGTKKPLKDGKYYLKDTKQTIKIIDGIVVSVEDYDSFKVKDDETPYVGYVKRIAKLFGQKLLELMEAETSISENYFKKLIRGIIK